MPEPVVIIVCVILVGAIIYMFEYTWKQSKYLLLLFFNLCFSIIKQLS